MKALASLLRRLADRLDTPAAPTGPAAVLSTVTAQLDEGDQRFLDNLILRDALHRALNRYQPFRPPAQA